MNLQRVKEIADAVLYEGYMLYPYRPSAVKNQQRFNFGVLCPPSYCAIQRGGESSFLQTECLFTANASTQLKVEIRFLQIVQRSIGRRRHQSISITGDATGELDCVDRLEVDGRVYQPWQEAVERSISYDVLDPASLLTDRFIEFSSPGDRSSEEIVAEAIPIGAIVRESQSLAGVFQIRAEARVDNVTKLSVRLENRSRFDFVGEDLPREAFLPYSFVSAHMILGIENGEFLSLLDPPPEREALARECTNIGNWPVLAGDDATTMLASPIILYDFPKIAPESAGNLFDATEIDEILSLRILTLTEQEKREIRQSDDRARELLERTEKIPNEQFIKLHGVLRGMTVPKEEQT